MELKYSFITGHAPGDVILQDMSLQEYISDSCLESYFPERQKKIYMLQCFYGFLFFFFWSFLKWKSKQETRYHIRIKSLFHTRNQGNGKQRLQFLNKF